MRRFAVALSIAVTLPLAAQPQPRVMRPRPVGGGADMAEAAIKQAMDQLVVIKKVVDRDLGVLNHLRAADDALVDAMQPTNAIEKSWDEVEAAKALDPEFFVKQGVIKAEHVLEDARRSPMSADIGRIRATLRDEALAPASRVAVRDALRLEDESLAWIRVQQLISDHLRQISEITNASLRASDR